MVGGVMWLFAVIMVGVVVVGEEVLDGVGGGSFAALVVGVVVIEGLLMGESLGVVVGVGGGHVGGEVQFPEPTEPLPHRARFVVGVFVVVDVIGAGAVTDVGGGGCCRSLSVGRGCGCGRLLLPIEIVGYRRGGWHRCLCLP